MSMGAAEKLDSNQQPWGCLAGKGAEIWPQGHPNEHEIIRCVRSHTPVPVQEWFQSHSGVKHRDKFIVYINIYNMWINIHCRATVVFYTYI